MASGPLRRRMPCGCAEGEITVEGKNEKKKLLLYAYVRMYVGRNKLVKIYEPPFFLFSDSISLHAHSFVRSRMQCSLYLRSLSLIVKGNSRLNFSLRLLYLK